MLIARPAGMHHRSSERAPRRQLHSLLFLLIVTLVCLSRPTVSRAESAPSLPGYATLGQVSVDKSGCSSCPLVLTTTKRHRTFALASDSPFPVSLSGALEVTCDDGATYQFPLRSPHRGGPFQIVPNTCANLASKEVKLTVTSVGLSPADAERSIGLIVYGSFG